VIAAASGGWISGQAPLFERFSLGDSSTLRGWNKFDVAPAGGDRAFHQSLEYRNHGVALFVDAGSVWDRDTDRKVRVATGFGYHTDGLFVTLGFPVNASHMGAIFMIGARF
jgi:outer membrane protein assembly factor BamA